LDRKSRRHRRTSSSRVSTPPTGLTWTDGRIADLKSHVRDASTRASEEVAALKAQITEFNEEASKRRLHRQTFLFCLFLLAILLVPFIVKGIVVLLA
jgi:hypothetical protein